MKRFKYLTLAALVGLWACDSGTSTTTEPTPTGTISGTVTIEGTGASGVTVTLSSGTTTTTGADGTYAFSNVNAGAYTVAISGYASDATFDATTKAATITSAGQVATVNFAGSYIKTSSIVGVVSAGSGALQGVNVALSGAKSASTTTDASGAYSFSGLRAGSYTVTISGWSSQYTFATPAQTVSLAVGESKVVSFTGQLATTASITGTLFVDENVKNGNYDSTEQPLAVANVTITLQNGLNDPSPMTTQTAADGSYSFTGLTAGTYQISIAASDTTIIPANYAFGGTSPQIVTTTAGSATPVNWPFNIVRQTVKVGAFLGRDAGVAMVAPIKGVTIDLYPTEADLNALTNKLGTAKTDETGYASIVFKRADEKSPAGGASDNIVFANYVSAPSALYQLNGETKLEIDYDPTTAFATGNDVFDFIYTQVVLGFAGQEIDGDSLPTWVTHTRVNDTTSTTGQVVQPLNAHGMTYVTINWTGSVNSPDSLYTRLTPAQTANNGHAWKQTPMPDMATAKGSFLQYNWDGTVLPTDTIMLGYADVKYLDEDVVLRLHREADDTAGFTKGDDFFGNGQVSAKIVNAKNVVQFGPTPFPGDPGKLTLSNVPVDSAWTAIAFRTSNNLVFLGDSTVALALDGSDQSMTVFDGATKTWKNRIEGDVFASDGVTGADSVAVTIAPTAMNIGGTWTRTIYTNAAGHYATPDSLLDGPYSITVADKAGRTKWAFFDTLEVASAPTSSGDADNADASSGVRDVLGNLDVKTANFQATRMDTKIKGRVVNDRDNDNNTIDPGEALAGAQIELVQKKTVLGTATTDASGNYSFTGLREGTYLVRWVDDTPDNSVQVLRALKTDSAFVTTTAAAPTAGGSIAALPRWDYTLSQGDGDMDVADFLFLYKNTTVKGTVLDGTTGIAGMTVSLRRCDDSAGAQSPPIAGTCTTYLGTTVTTQSDSNGVFTFSNLTEGVYEITPLPNSVGSYTTSVPVHRLYVTLGSGDIEDGSFSIS